MKLLLFFISDISFRTFSHSLILFFLIFTPSSWKSNRHLCQKSPHIQRHMNHRNWWISWCANKNKQSSRQIRCLYTKIWKSCGTFKERRKWKICKSDILFFWEVILIPRQNNNIWVQMQSWWWWFADS